MRIASGIAIRESQVKSWLKERGFKGEYLLVSTKKEVRDHPPAGEAGRSEIRGGRLIVDLYTPLLLEKKVSFRWWNPFDWRVRQVARNNIRSYLLAGDHFLVANRRQREYWIGVSNDLGIPLKLNDISVFPTGSGNRFSISDSRLAINDRKTVLWFGGIYPWMDPRPLVEAFSRVCRKYPKWRLRFLGGWHPATGYKGIYRRLKEFSKQMIPQNQLEFVPWQKEKDLVKYFRDAAFAVHLAKQTSEDFYAHRVRLLTLFSAGIPVLTSGRDVISDLAVKLGAAARTKPGRDSVEKNLISLFSFSDQLNKMRKSCLVVEGAFIQQETDIQIKG